MNENNETWITNVMFYRSNSFTNYFDELAARQFLVAFGRLCGGKMFMQDFTENLMF